jgi:hypothetical protein
MYLLKPGLAGAVLALAAVPAQAQIDNRDPGRFVQSIAQTGFGSLKGPRSAARGKFRAILAQHFAVDAIGDRLIQRWRRQITPQQYAAYRAAFPNFIIGTYADRLYDYSDASLKVVRVQNQGANAAVLTQVTKPGGRPGDGDLDADPGRPWLQGAEPHGRRRQSRGCARGGFRQLHSAQRLRPPRPVHEQPGLSSSPTPRSFRAKSRNAARASRLRSKRTVLGNGTKL